MNGLNIPKPSPKSKPLQPHPQQKSEDKNQSKKLAECTAKLSQQNQIIA